jgi:Spermine/spermidine synthase domain
MAGSRRGRVGGPQQSVAPISDRPYADDAPRRRLATIRSSYSEIVVDGTDTARYLWFGYARQAGVRIHDGAFDFEMAFGSSQRCFDLADLYQPDPKSELYVGLGAGNAPMRSALRRPRSVVEVVEIDPVVVDVARDWFGFEPDRCRVHIADALAFLGATDRRWDRIVLDAFLSAGGTSEVNVAPSYFSESAFVELLARRLGEDGLLLANLNGALRGADSAPFLSVLKIIEEVFGQLAVHSVADRTGDGHPLLEHPDLELADEHYMVLASGAQLPSAEEVVSLAQAAQGSAFVDADIVTFARNRIDVSGLLA